MARKRFRRLIPHFMTYFIFSSTALVLASNSFNLFSKFRNQTKPKDSASSYCMELAFPCILFMHCVFRIKRHFARKMMQITLLGVSGMIGLILMFYVSTKSIDTVGGERWESKVSAVLVSFIMVYWLGKKLVFSRAI